MSKPRVIYTPAYLTDGTLIYVPEKGMFETPEGHTSKPLRGMKYSQAVFNPAGDCVGWVSVFPETDETVRTSQE